MEELFWKVAEATIPIVVKETYKELKVRLRAKLREPKVYAIGYVSAFYDTIHGYTREIFKNIFRDATGINEIPNMHESALGRIYFKGKEAYAVLVESYTLRDFSLIFPEEELEIEEAVAEAVTAVNVRITPLTQDALQRLGIVLSQVAMELSKLKGSVSVKVKLFGLRLSDVKAPEKGKVLSDDEGVMIVFYDPSEPRTYDFSFESKIDKLLGSIKQHIGRR